VTPDDFNYSDSIIYLAMVVIGGLGSIPGVIVGAIVVYSINLFVLTQLDTLASDPSSPLHVITVVLPGFTFDSIRNLIFGTILVVVMLFRPEGLIPSARRRRELHHAEAEAPEEGSLDTPPGMAGFEEEIRVE
jgi:ABC-type branched-subunit amino acid transport system permease subunit